MLKNLKRLTSGNTKLNNCLIFDLPAIKTCPNHKDCSRVCYAKKAEVQYANTKKRREDNLKLSKTKSFVDIISRQLSKTKKSVIRVHTSGDFYSQDYFNKWCEIASRFPNKIFYAFTKSKVNSTLAPPNLNIISSYINGLLNFGDKNHINNLVTNHKAFLCPVTHPYKNSKIQCGVNCKYCQINKNVVFLQH